MCVNQIHNFPHFWLCRYSAFCSSVSISQCFYKESIACSYAESWRLVCQFAIVPWSGVCSFLK